MKTLSEEKIEMDFGDIKAVYIDIDVKQAVKELMERIPEFQRNLETKKWDSNHSVIKEIFGDDLI